MANGAANGERSASRALLVYNVLRFGLFAICFGIGWLAGLRSIAVILAALLVSGVLSWFLLRPQRIAMGRAVEQTVERSRVRMAAHTSAEDTYVDAMLADETTSPGQSASDPGDPTS